jgi:DNA-binding XRE family transcriptional regulator
MVPVSSNNGDNELGKKVRALRKLKRWTQADLAKRAGLAPRTIHNLEVGMYVPRASTLRSLDEIFGDTIEHIELKSAS